MYSHSRVPESVWKKNYKPRGLRIKVSCHANISSHSNVNSEFEAIIRQAERDLISMLVNHYESPKIKTSGDFHCTTEAMRPSHRGSGLRCSSPSGTRPLNHIQKHHGQPHQLQTTEAGLLKQENGQRYSPPPAAADSIIIIHHLNHTPHSTTEQNIYHHITTCPLPITSTSPPSSSQPPPPSPSPHPQCWCIQRILEQDGKGRHN